MEVTLTRIGKPHALQKELPSIVVKTNALELNRTTLGGSTFYSRSQSIASIFLRPMTNSITKFELILRPSQRGAEQSQILVNGERVVANIEIPLTPGSLIHFFGRENNTLSQYIVEKHEQLAGNTTTASSSSSSSSISTAAAAAGDLGRSDTLRSLGVKSRVTGMHFGPACGCPTASLRRLCTVPALPLEPSGAERVERLPTRRFPLAAAAALAARRESTAAVRA